MAHPLAQQELSSEEQLEEALKPREELPGIAGLYSLALQGRWRGVVARCEELLPADGRVARLSIGTFHVMGLIKLGLLREAVLELKNLEITGAVRTETDEEIPYALHWLAAEVCGRMGDWKAAGEGFSSLLQLTQRVWECLRPDDPKRFFWKSRRARTAAALAAVLLRQGHAAAALSVLDAELARDGHNPETWLHAACLQLRIGDVAGASASIESASYVLEEKERGDASVAPDIFKQLDPLGAADEAWHGRQRRLATAIRIGRGLVAVCRQDWADAARAFRAEADVEAVGNLAVCTLYAGDVEGAIQQLAKAFHADPLRAIQEPLVANMLLLMDLTCPNARAKQQFVQWVESMAPDDLDVAVPAVAPL